MATYDRQGFTIILGGEKAIHTGHECIKHALMSINECKYRRQGQRREICQY